MARSGLYIVTLNNDQPISVNAQDPRRADKAIKVTKANCKFGKARDLEARRQNYYKTFGEINVNYQPIALVQDIDSAERAVLAALEGFRIRSRTGIKNEWLQCVGAETVLSIAVEQLDRTAIAYELLVSDVAPLDSSVRDESNGAEKPRKQELEYEGQYRIAKSPRRLKSHNEVSWRKIDALIEKNGGEADFDHLVAVVRGHRHHGYDAANPHQFIMYCIRNGWLERV